MTTATIHRSGQQISVMLRPLIVPGHNNACQWVRNGRVFFVRQYFLTDEEARQYMLRFHPEAEFREAT